MAPRNSVPRICRHYHYRHLPPPEEPTRFMGELRRGLRGVDKGGFWGKVKSAGWRILRGCLLFYAKITMLTTPTQSKLTTTSLRKSHLSARTSRLRRLRLPALVFGRSLQTSTSRRLGGQITTQVPRHPRRMASSSSPSAHRVWEGNDAKRHCLRPRAHSRPHLARRRVLFRTSRAARGRISLPRSLRRLRR
jgi:hypothetical protein